MTSPLATTLLLAALAAAGTALAPPAAADHDHACPAGYEAKEAETRKERAADRNDDGRVCVRETDDGTDVRDDSHGH